MQITFDIAEDELQVFMPEAEEQLQKLEDGLMQLERSGPNDDLLQVIFRAAHTLKGAAGAIGHTRMTELTHAMETVLDGLRKGQHSATPLMMEALLAGLDALRLLLEEVVTHEVSDVDHHSLVDALEVQMASRPATEAVAPTAAQPEAAPAADGEAVQVVVDIDPASVASAARALQIMITLQGLGTLTGQEPSTADIEAAKPCQRFVGQLPSTAIFVNAEDDVAPVAEALNEALSEHNIQVIACREGQAVGQESNVRVFDIQHIKGLEFEAVFFVGIDQLAALHPALFDKYLYVGTTRAATYLGVSCDGALPPAIEELRPLFGQHWQAPGTEDAGTDQ